MKTAMMMLQKIFGIPVCESFVPLDIWGKVAELAARGIKFGTFEREIELENFLANTVNQAIQGLGIVQSDFKKPKEQKVRV